MKRLTLSLGLGLCCSACAVESPLPVGQAAYQIIPPEISVTENQQYLIAPLDTVSVTVFNEPELTVEDRLVDTAGRLPLPLLGSVSAAGKSPEALAEELERDLSAYLINPRVSVSVNAIVQRVAVEGNVGEPGIFDIRGSSSLLEAMALAQSPTDLADLDQIFVYRKVAGQMRGARFDLARIRVGLDPDPVILAGDRIVVGRNAWASAWQNYLSSPVDSVFRLLTVCAVDDDC